MPGARIVWIVTMKFRPGEDRREPVMKTPTAAAMTMVFENMRAERRVERPAGVDAAGDQRPRS